MRPETDIRSIEPSLLFVVEQVFQISNIGCVVAPGVTPRPGIPEVRAGDPIRLLKPDGEVVDTRIHSIPHFNYGSRPRPEVLTFPFVLPLQIAKEDVPLGTRVFHLA